uniref:Uncharacterized protein n=1 Tax=Tetranychus urticae TaxID=32264 RepID=T1K2F2_TETUR
MFTFLLANLTPDAISKIYVKQLKKRFEGEDLTKKEKGSAKVFPHSNG